MEKKKMSVSWETNLEIPEEKKLRIEILKQKCRDELRTFKITNNAGISTMTISDPIVFVVDNSCRKLSEQ